MPEMSEVEKKRLVIMNTQHFSDEVNVFFLFSSCLTVYRTQETHCKLVLPKSQLLYH